VSFNADEADMVVSTLIVAYNMLDTIMLRLNLAIENHPWLGSCEGRNQILVPPNFKFAIKPVADPANPIGVITFDEFGTLYPNC